MVEPSPPTSRRLRRRHVLLILIVAAAVIAMAIWFLFIASGGIGPGSV